MFSRCSQDDCRVFSGWSFQMKDPKELDDPQLFDDPSYSLIPSYSMIPSHLMILSYSMTNWKYGLWQSNSLRWYLHRWWSCLNGKSVAGCNALHLPRATDGKCRWTRRRLTQKLKTQKLKIQKLKTQKHKFTKQDIKHRNLKQSLKHKNSKVIQCTNLMNQTVKRNTYQEHICKTYKHEH